MSDPRLIVSLDVPDVLAGLSLVEKLGDAVSRYRIGLGLLTGGGLALANELAGAHGKRIFMDLKLFGPAGEIEAAVRGFAAFDLDMLSVHADPAIVAAALRGAEGSAMKIIAECILPDPAEGGRDIAARALEAGADGVIVGPGAIADLRAGPLAAGRILLAAASDADRNTELRAAVAAHADFIIVGADALTADNPEKALPGLLQP